MTIQKELSAFFAREGIALFGALSFEDCRVINGALLDRSIANCRSAIVYALPYYAGIPEKRNLSLYAAAKDYHIYIKGLNERLTSLLAELFPGERSVGFGDHSPIDERLACAVAGLGRLGDNGLLITEKYGSYVFLGEVLTTAEIAVPMTTPKEIRSCLHCGACKRACPYAFADCASGISQKKGELTHEEEEKVLQTGLIWGCDLCQTCCPLNKNAEITPIPFFKEDLITVLDEETLEGMDKETFRSRAFAWKGKGPLRRNLALEKRSKHDET